MLCKLGLECLPADNREPCVRFTESVHSASSPRSRLSHCHGYLTKSGDSGAQIDSEEQESRR